MAIFGGKKKKVAATIKPVQHVPEMSEDAIKKALLSENYVSEQDVLAAEEYSKKNDSNFLNYLIRKNILTKDLVGQAMAESLGVPYADLNSNIPPVEQIAKIPEKIALRERVVLFSEKDNDIVITTDRPNGVKNSETIRQLFPTKKITVALSLTEDIENILLKYRKSLETRFSKIIKQRGRVAPEIIDEIFSDAILYHASDIHFEPHEKEIVIRFRIDGVLHEAGRIPKEYFENILNRIKVQARLRIDKHNAAQDGAMRFTSQNNAVADIRVSIVPTLDGEKIVMRMLTEYVQQLSINDLGLSPSRQKLLEKAARSPFGMVIVCGPTGSGKTTTLYALLKHISSPNVNITTIEDPVEYKLITANQIQVNPETRLTFAEGLRSIVRQDPDIILVGEIRDEETADIATNAALTGHLLFSTFHANDSATTIPRLLDMGVEPFLLASTLELIIAQRLLRQICESCRISYPINIQELEKTMKNPERYFQGTITLYKGKGCSACNHTGYKGRIGVFETLPITPPMAELILKNPSTKEIWEVAKNEGAESMFDDGIEKIKSGATTIEELVRVVKPPDA